MSYCDYILTINIWFYNIYIAAILLDINYFIIISMYLLSINCYCLITDYQYFMLMTKSLVYQLYSSMLMSS